tara:strand:+ start:374 stop:478 length:105 start_codon:yes stop_codon:yes gene_type:complete
MLHELGVILEEGYGSWREDGGTRRLAEKNEGARS